MRLKMRPISVIIPTALALSCFNSYAVEQESSNYDFLVGARISQLSSDLGNSSDEDMSYGAEFIFSKGFEYRPKLSAGVHLAIDVGKVTHKGYTNDFDVETWSLSPFISYQVIERLELLAKVGVSNWSYKTNTTELNGYDPVYGIGLRYNFNRIYAGLEWQYVEMNDKAIDLDSELTTLSFGVRF